jgi:hypothetical protein
MGFDLMICIAIGTGGAFKGFIDAFGRLAEAEALGDG